MRCTSICRGMAAHGENRPLCIARVLRLPYLVCLHSGRYPEFWEERRPWQKRAIKTMFGKAARVVVLGKVWRDFVEAEQLAEPVRIVILPNAASKPRLSPKRGVTAKLAYCFLGSYANKRVCPADPGIKSPGDAGIGMQYLPAMVKSERQANS